jgi:prophage antirepressor-like protein
MKFLHEPDLYRLITHSKLPSAEKFMDWVYEEVLPSIRKTGGYVKQQGLMIPEMSSEAIKVLLGQVERAEQAEGRAEAVGQRAGRYRRLPRGQNEHDGAWETSSYVLLKSGRRIED